MMVFDVLPLVAGLTALFMTIVVLITGRAQDRYPFSLFAFGMAAWAILITWFLFTANPDTAQLIARSYYVAAALLIYGFLLFCIAFTAPATMPRRLRLAVWPLLVPVLLVVWLVWQENFLTVYGSSTEHTVLLGEPHYALYAVFFILYAITAFAVLSRYLLRPDASIQKRSQVKIITWVMVFALPFGALFNLILPYWGNYELIMIGPLFVLPIVAVVFYAVTRHGLFDVRSAAVRGLAYVLSLTSLAGVYYFLAYIASVLVFKGEVSSSVSVSPVNIALALVLAFTFQPIKRFFDRLTVNIFYRNAYDSRQVLNALNHVFISTVTFDTLLQRTVGILKETFRASYCTVLVVDDTQDTGNVAYGDTARLPGGVTIRQVATLSNKLKQGVIVTAELSDEAPKLREQLEEADAAVVVPIVEISGRGRKCIGFIALGSRKSGGKYTSQDIALMDTIAKELVVGIQSALRLKQIEQFNETLKQRIDSATRELRESNEKLKAIDSSKDDFISMASHQLRTPLTSVKGYLSMVLEGDAGKVPENQRKMLEQAFTSSQRMTYLISDLLNLSRLKTGKFVILPSQVNLARVVEQEVNQLRRMAEANTIELVVNLPDSLPELELDETKMRQVIMNLIDNAIYYTPARGTITVELRETVSSVEFTVTDTGIGVPKAEQHKLFSRFYRASNAKKSRPDGTGLGLFMAKKAVAAQGGAIIFRSTEGQGSTFGFSFPKKRRQY